MRFRYFLEEILRGKAIGRAMLFIALKKFFEENPWLNNEFLVLELGSEPASHQRALPREWKIRGSNYQLMPGLDLIIDAEKRFPVSNNDFDGVIFFNVLPVIDDYMNCLKESLRVARKFILFNIPLISGTARHPKDFSRFPQDRLLAILDNLKKDFLISEYQIIPIGGSFSSAIHLIDPYLKFRIIRVPIYLLAILLDKLDMVIKRSCPLQYLVLIRK